MQAAQPAILEDILDDGHRALHPRLRPLPAVPRRRPAPQIRRILRLPLQRIRYGNYFILNA